MVTDLLVNQLELVIFQSVHQHGFGLVTDADRAARNRIRFSSDIAPGETVTAQDFCRQPAIETECTAATALEEAPAGCRRKDGQECVGVRGLYPGQS